MQIHDTVDPDGRVTSFEIANIGRSRAVRVIRKAFPSAVIRQRRADDFAEVELDGRRFVFTEPWGDNSRYLIHASPLETSAELDALRTAFRSYRPSPVFSGDRPFLSIVIGLAVVFGVIAVTIWMM